MDTSTCKGKQQQMRVDKEERLSLVNVDFYNATN